MCLSLWMINGFEKLNETSLPEKEEFYSNLNIEDITDANYIHTKGFYKDFETNNLDEYHDLYLKMIHYFKMMFLKILEKHV